MLSYVYITLYVLAWVVTLILYQRKRKAIDAGSVLLVSYLVLAILSFFLYESGIYDFKRIELLPFVYLYSLLLLVSMPVFKYDSFKIDRIQEPSSLILNTVSLVFIISTIVWIPSVLSEFTSGNSVLFLDAYVGAELYNDAYNIAYFGDDADDGLNLPAIISGNMSVLGVLLLFYYLTLEKGNRLVLIGLLVSNISLILPSLLRGQRNGIIETMLVMVVTYFALKKFIPKRVNRQIKIVGLALVIVSLIPFITITFSRFSESNLGAGGSLLYYAGQANLFFNNYGLDGGGIRYGDRTVPLFKRVLGFENVPRDFWERRHKYSHLKIDDGVFITFVGDFTLDFGPVAAAIILMLFTAYIINRTRIRNQRLLFHQLILLHLVMYLCIIGSFKLYPYADAGGNIKLVVLFIAYGIFRWDYKRRVKLGPAI